MKTVPRHECLVYEGPPSRHLPALAASAQNRLEQGYRCLYLNSPTMVSGLRSYLAASGIDVACAVAKASFVLSSDRSFLKDSRFDISTMIAGLDDAVNQALADGYKGLWATGDLGWQFGPGGDFGKILEYEWRLEELFRRQPALCGICQYHRDTLPDAAIRDGLLAHPSIFVNETLSRLNPYYVRSMTGLQLTDPGLEYALTQLCRLHDSG